MKKIFLFLFIVLAFALSCKKEKSTDATTPKWLQDKIALAEKEIQTSSKSGYTMAAWYQYQYKGTTYYQLHNPVSSLAYDVYKTDGAKPDFPTEEYQNYQAKRCCAKQIWKGPDFNENLTGF